MRSAIIYNDTSKLTEKEIAFLTYFNYSKVIRGKSWAEFCEEDVEVVAYLLEIKSLEIELQNKDGKQNRYNSHSKGHG